MPDRVNNYVQSEVGPVPPPPELKWFKWQQNNSGGRYVHDREKGIGAAVYIQDYDLARATDRALALGIYYFGCLSGIDCQCCGDRWSSIWPDEDVNLTPEEQTKRWFGCLGKGGCKSYIENGLYAHPKVGSFRPVEFNEDE